MANVGKLEARLTMDAGQFIRASKSVQAQVRKLSSSFTAFSRLAQLVIGATIVKQTARAAFSFVKLASDATESLNLMTQSFGEQVPVVEKWAKTVADESKRSRFEVMQMAGELQALIVTMVGSRDAATGLSTELAALAIDVASFRNLAEADVIEKFGSALAGQTRSARTLGADIRIAALNAFAFAEGINKTVDEMNELERTTLIAKKLIFDLGFQLGDAKRTSEEFANVMKSIAQAFNDVRREIGGVIKAGVNVFARALRDFLITLRSNDQALRDFALRIGVALVDAFIVVAKFAGGIATLFEKAKNQVAQLIKAIAKIAVQLIPTFKDIETAALNTLRTVADNMFVVLDAAAEWRPELEKVAKTMKDVGNRMAIVLLDQEKRWKGVETAAKNSLMAAEETAKEAREELNKKQAIIDAIVKKLIELGVEAKKAMEIASKSAMRLGGDVEALRKRTEVAAKAQQRFKKEVEKAASAIEKQLTKNLTEFGTKLPSALNPAIEVVRQFAQQIRDLANQPFMTTEDLEAAREQLTNLTKSTGELLIQIKKVGESALEMSQTFVDAAQGIFDSLKSSISNTLADAVFEGKTQFETLEAFAKQVGRSIFTTLINAFIDFVAARIGLETTMQSALTAIAAKGNSARVSADVTGSIGRAKAALAAAKAQIGIERIITAEAQAGSAQRSAAAASEIPPKVAAAHASIPIVGAIIAAGVLTALLAIATRGKKFAKGGIVDGPGGVDNVPIMATAGEAVLSKDVTKALMQTLGMPQARIEPPAFQNGGIVSGGGGDGGGGSAPVNLTIQTFGAPDRASMDRWVRDVVQPALERANSRKI